MDLDDDIETGNEAIDNLTKYQLMLSLNIVKDNPKAVAGSKHELIEAIKDLFSDEERVSKKVYMRVLKVFKSNHILN